MSICEHLSQLGGVLVLFVVATYWHHHQQPSARHLQHGATVL